MILTLMLVILTATLVIVIIGFVMDRMAVTKLKSGMRTLNKRIKRLEADATIRIDCELDDGKHDATMGKELREALYYTEASDDSLDTKTDTETETSDGGDISLETDDEIQNAGD